MTHEEDPIQKLRESALALTKTAANLDEEISKLTKSRAAIQKELRGVTSKITTLELRKALAA